MTTVDKFQFASSGGKFDYSQASLFRYAYMPDGALPTMWLCVETETLIWFWR